jgi:hypothetical protein
MFVSDCLCKADLVVSLALLDADVIHRDRSAAPIFCPPRRIAIWGDTRIWWCTGVGQRSQSNHQYVEENRVVRLEMLMLM